MRRAVVLVLASLLATSASENLHHVMGFDQEFVVLEPKHHGWPSGDVTEHNSCLHFAKYIEEPYTDRYYPRSSFNLSYPWTAVPRAYWRWDGPKFTREAFRAAVAAKPRCRCGKGCCACSGCDQAMHYKIIGGRLWKDEPCDACGNRVHTAEETIKVALHLFPIPDMEFALYFGDDCFSDQPTINYCFCRNATGGGFTMPSYGVWMGALGPYQMAAFHACLDARYPRTDRLPLAIWRGSSTNPEIVNEENYMRAPRLKVHMMTREHPDLLDAKITSTTVRLAPHVRTLFNDTASKLQPEEYNRYCAVLHFDGNGWSDRFAQSLIHYPTPILRIASNITAYFDHVFAPDEAFEPFAPDLSNLLDRIRFVVEKCVRDGEESALYNRVERLRSMAVLYMDHVGVAEAMAYALHAYRNHTGFEMDYGLEGFRELNMSCCKYTNIPHGLSVAMTERWNKLRSADAGAENVGTGARTADSGADVAGSAGSTGGSAGGAAGSETAGHDGSAGREGTAASNSGVSGAAAAGGESQAAHATGAAGGGHTEGESGDSSRDSSGDDYGTGGDGATGGSHFRVSESTTAAGAAAGAGAQATTGDSAAAGGSPAMGATAAGGAIQVPGAAAGGVSGIVKDYGSNAASEADRAHTRDEDGVGAGRTAAASGGDVSGGAGTAGSAVVAVEQAAVADVGVLLPGEGGGVSGAVQVVGAEGAAGGVLAAGGLLPMAEDGATGRSARRDVAPGVLLPAVESAPSSMGAGGLSIRRDVAAGVLLPAGEAESSSSGGTRELPGRAHPAALEASQPGGT